MSSDLIPIEDPLGIGPTIWVTPEEYESIEETASILAEEELMRALRLCQPPLDETSDELRRKLGL